ncbi:hypothetical protein VTJ49DRAFT_4159 [Mycothermus thermophilus]|uniref:Uncharacterized protein n=1 Tax=Humicola insolens TaxID=85995 RepID=A0ABR3V631_HUMIN
MSGTEKTANTDSGATGAAKTVTSTLGNTTGSLLNTVGGETVNAATGGLGKPVGDAVSNVGTSVEAGVGSVAQGTKDAGEWKTPAGGK